ncbi:MAG: Mannose-6-phosphate isomerase [Cirrosporium novae-zelandiae]|nr:MAG: Mannose-6-phosphate isomerase [Cirrosporium novae-zelandiae]
MQVPLIRLQCGTNNYEWGKLGNDSAAAKFAAANASGDFSIQEDKPYSELWMGTHPTLPSKDFETNRTLLDILQDNQALMSQDIAQRYDGKLPFLFKVLSIQKALSIQAHPNKKLAQRLHELDPKNYPDDNHKPEMVIAITEFEGFCGFRPLAEIKHFLTDVPPLRRLVGEDAARNFEAIIRDEETSSQPEDENAKKTALQDTFSALMNADKDAIASEAKELVSLAEKEGEAFAGHGGPTNTGKELSELVIRLNGQFPADIGLFVLFFLNYIKLQPGESMFLEADDIHAYLSGDAMECMASSDNVVRSGFTPKFKDVKTLTTMLTYNYAPISEQKMNPVDYPYVTLNLNAYTSASSSMLYDPPTEEFSVVKTDLRKAGAKATFEPLAGPSILICTQGVGKISVGPKVEEIKSGYVFFIGATAEMVLESTGDENFVTFKAFCDLHGLEGLTNGH